ncbi:MAG TPA: DUF2795 domain-containing protein [Acidimicrobiales bacterium]|nr:DUF2795 domain-containing protein [Acidimicrobiales bacterium]
MTDKHGPRLDDAMNREVQSLIDGGVEARSQEGRMQEPTFDEETPLDPGARWDEDQDPGIGVSPATADERAELAKAVASVQWPATRDDLVRAARDDFAPDRVVALLEELPHGDRTYETVQAVWSALGGDTEQTHTQ